MRTVLLFVLLLPVVVFAHKPILPEFNSYDNYYQIPDATDSRAFYGELAGFPHTYVLLLTEETDVYVQILVPDIKSVKNNINGLIVRQLPSGRVEGVVSLPATEADWETFYEPWGGDSYREGGVFEDRLSPGSYLIEVSNGDNVGKYVMSTGRLENFDDMSYYETLVRIYQVKQFMDKSFLAMLQTPFFLVPFLLVLGLIYGGYRLYKRRYA